MATAFRRPHILSMWKGRLHLASAALIGLLSHVLGATASAQSNLQPPPVYATPPQYGVAPPAYVAPVPYAGAPGYTASPEAARSAYVQSLTLQREALLRRPVGLALPVTFFAVGLSAIVVGGVFVTAFDACNGYADNGSCGVGPGTIAGVLMEIGGGVLATVGTGMFIGRLIRRGRRSRELRRIDMDLRSLGVTVSLEPWLTSKSESVSTGLNATAYF